MFVALRFADHGIVHPEHLTLLTTALDRYCAIHGIDRSENALRELVAARLLTLFQKGVRTQNELLKGVGDIIPRVP